MEFYLESAFSDRPKNLSIEDKREITKELLPQIRKISDPVIRGEYLQKLAGKLGTDEKYLEEALEKLPERQEYHSQKKVIAPQPFKENLEERIIAEILAYPKTAQKFIKEVSISDFNDENSRKIYQEIKKLYNKTKDFTLEKIKKKLPKNSEKRLDLMLLKVAEDLSGLTEKELYQEIGFSISRLKSEKSNIIKRDFENKIREAEAAGDRQKVKKLIEEFQAEIIKS